MQYRDLGGELPELAMAGAGAAGGVITTAAAVGGANFWNPVGWTIIGVTAVAAVGLVGYEVYQTAQISQAASRQLAKDIGGVASKFPYGKCVEAAKAITKFLALNSIEFSVIAVVFPGDIVGSNTTNRRVSENHFHIGVNVGGTVFCNIHPFGLKKKAWINDFYDLFGSKPVVIELGTVAAVLKQVKDTIVRF